MKWLDAKFQERLAAYKHEQQKELEQLRFKINSLLDRVTKFHQREFEVLPEAWSRLNDAYAATVALISSMQSYPDLNHITNEQLDEFLSTSLLQQWERVELKSAPDKLQYYTKRISWHRLSHAKGLSRECHDYMRKNGIFIPENVKQQFAKLDDLIWSAVTEYEVNLQFRERGVPPSHRDNTLALQKEGEALLKILEAEVHGRLWNAPASSL